MKREIRDKWTAALRSSNYRQGKGALNKRNRFCCLGVLCDVMGMPKVKSLNGAWSYDGKTTMIDNVHLMPRDGTTKAFDLKWKLADMNDGVGEGNKRFTFPEIADWIEANVPVED